MNNASKISKSARAIGVMIAVLTGLVFGQIPDTFKVQCNLSGDISNGIIDPITFTAFAIATPPSRGGGTMPNITTGYRFTNLSVFWYGKVSVTGPGFVVTPKDTQLTSLTHNININFNVRDTMQPLQKLTRIKDTSIFINQLFTFCDTIYENSSRIKSIQYDFSTDSGKTWDTIGSERWVSPKYLPVSNNIYVKTRHAYSFIPKVASNNYTLRVIATDFFQGNADTVTVTFKTMQHVGIRTINKTPKIIKEFSTRGFDLTGRKIPLQKSSKLYVKNNSTRAFIKR